MTIIIIVIIAIVHEIVFVKLLLILELLLISVGKVWLIKLLLLWLHGRIGQERFIGLGRCLHAKWRLLAHDRLLLLLLLLLSSKRVLEHLNHLLKQLGIVQYGQRIVGILRLQHVR